MNMEHAVGWALYFCIGGIVAGALFGNERDPPNPLWMMLCMAGWPVIAAGVVLGALFELGARIGRL